MRIQKQKLIKALNQVKGVMQKCTADPALEGVLVSGGYLLASNHELTVQVKLEGSEDESLLLPAKAIEIIRSLPDGEVEIKQDMNNTVNIRMDKIRSSCKSFAPESYAYGTLEFGACMSVVVDGKELMEALEHVVFAAADKANNPLFQAVYFGGALDHIDLVALDGRVVATETVGIGEPSDMCLNVPKTAVKKLLSLGLEGDVEIFYNNIQMAFRTKDCIIFTRLYTGMYFQYQRFFTDSAMYTEIDRKQFMDALTRMKTCSVTGKPVVLQLKEKRMDLSVAEYTIEHEESLELIQEMTEPLRICFDPKLLLEAVKAFDCDLIRLGFTSPKQPLRMDAQDGRMKVLVLPTLDKASPK